MRRHLLIAAFVLAVSLGSASAQMRGGGMGHGGMGRSGGAIASRGFVGGGIAPHPGGLPRGSFAPRIASRNSINLRIGFNPRFGNRFAIDPRFGFRHRRVFFPNQLFFGGWPYYGWGDPFYDSSYYSSNSYDAAAQNDYYQQQQVDADLQNLRDEVRTLREENENARYAERQRPPVPERMRESPTDTPSTVLIFKDGHKVETRNYAIVGQTLWLLDERRATKLPISDLDVAATTSADDQRGIDFRLPLK